MGATWSKKKGGMPENAEKLLQTAIRQKAPPLGCSGQTIQPIRLKFEREHEIVKILTFRLINLFLNQIL